MEELFLAPLLLLQKVARMYEEATGKSFSSLFASDLSLYVSDSSLFREMAFLPGTKDALSSGEATLPRKDGAISLGTPSSQSPNLFLLACEEVKGKISRGELPASLWGEVKVERHWQEMSWADLEVFASCLKASLREPFYLLRYDEVSMWVQGAYKFLPDVWDAYGGIYKQLRSVVLNLQSWTVASLPFTKFRNLGETESYSMEEIQRRLSLAGNERTEVSEKLDGSMVQLRFLGKEWEEDLFRGVLVSTSGSLVPSQSRHLADILSYLRTSPQAEYIYKLVMAHPGQTFLFEWIDERDPHVVVYESAMQGLHLIGIRDVETGALFPYREVRRLAGDFSVPATTLYSLSFDEALALLPTWEGSHHEGFVLNIDGFLVKMKCPSFLSIMKAALHSQSMSVCIEMAAEGKADDFLSQLPEASREKAKGNLEKIFTFERDVLSRTEELYASLPLSEGTKAVMLAIDALCELPLVKGLLRNKYLGRPLEVLSRRKGKNVSYLSPTVMEKFYAGEKNLPGAKAYKEQT